MSHSLAEINAMDRDAFIAALGAIYENSPWVAEGGHESMPFASVDALQLALQAVVDTASKARQIILIQAHPDLAGKAARAGELGEHSKSEQAGVGLDRLSDSEYARFHELNTAYMNRFQFPFVIAVRKHTKESILQAYEVRLKHTREVEVTEALRNIHLIAEFRLRDIVTQA